MWEYMGLIRIFTKRKGHPPDLTEPVILSSERSGTNVKAATQHISREMIDIFNYALVSGWLGFRFVRCSVWAVWIARPLLLQLGLNVSFIIYHHHMDRTVNGTEAAAFLGHWGGGHYLASPNAPSPWLSSPLPAAFSIIWTVCFGRVWGMNQVWGRSTKHDPMRCGLAHQLQDEDVLQIVPKTVTQQVCGNTSPGASQACVYPALRNSCAPGLEFGYWGVFFCRFFRQSRVSVFL